MWFSTFPIHQCDYTHSIIFLLLYAIIISINLTTRLQCHPTRPDLSRVGPDLSVLPTVLGCFPLTLIGKCATEQVLKSPSNPNDTYSQGGRR